jgi:TM2 domain-containing membrane protein YozV/DNA-directed RNA polymerase subunit RPC12/RpoP
MPFVVTCDNCRKRFSAPDAAKGKSVKCPDCGYLLVIRSPNAPAEHTGARPTIRRKLGSSSATRGEKSSKSACPHCESVVSIPPLLANELVECPICRGTFYADGSQPQTLPPTRPVTPSRTKACPFCAEPIAADAIKCKHCGSMLFTPARSEFGADRKNGAGRVVPSNPPKDPLLMAMLSGCCIAGLGQIVLGQTIKGVIILIGTVLFTVATSGIGAFIVWPLSAADAYLIAKKLRKGESVGDWECF